MSAFRRLVPVLLRRYLARLRFPTLFVVTVVVFAVNVAVPDALPFVDEALLALAGLLLGRLRRRGGGEGERVPGQNQAGVPDGRGSRSDRDPGPSDAAGE